MTSELSAHCAQGAARAASLRFLGAALAISWGTLALAKVPQPRQLGDYLHRALGVGETFGSLLAWLTVIVEIALALGHLWALYRPAKSRLPAAASTLVAGGFVLFSIWSPGASDCGCMGTLTTATAARRLLVASGILYLALAALALTTGAARTSGARVRLTRLLGTGAAIVAVLLGLLLPGRGKGSDIRAEEYPVAEVASSAVPVLQGTPPQRVGRMRPESPEAASAGASPTTGRVVDSKTGATLAGALVYFLPRDARSVSAQSGGVTDVGGLFSLAAPASTAPMALYVIRNGFLPYISSEQQTEAWNGQRVEVQMERGRAIEGRVLDETGAPVGGARVVASAAENRIGWPLSKQPLLLARTADGAESVSDDGGFFSISGLPAVGVFVVRAQKSLWFPYGPPAYAHPGDRDIRLELRPVAIITWEARDEAEDNPIQGVSMMCRGLGRAGIFNYSPSTPFVNGEGPSDTDSQEESRTLRLYRDASDSKNIPISVDIEADVRCIGFDAKKVSLRAVFGQRTSVTIRLKRSSVGAFVPVDIVARPEGVLGDRSRIRLEVRDMESGLVGSYAADPLTGAEDLRLPLGNFSFRIVEATRGGEWLGAGLPAREARMVPGLNLVECGVPVDRLVVNVIDPEGRNVRGFDLALLGVGESESLIHGHKEPLWDLPSESGEPFVLLPAGAFKVRANLPGVGAAVAVIRSLGSGAEQRVSLQLVAGDDDESRKSPASLQRAREIRPR